MNYTVHAFVGFVEMVVFCQLLYAQSPDAKPPQDCRWAPITVGLPRGEDAEQRPAAERDADRSVESIKSSVPWKQLSFSQTRRVKCVRLVWFRFKNGFERAAPDVIDYDCDEPKVIHAVQVALKYANRAAPELDGVGAMGDLPLGQLQVCTTDGVIVIAIHKRGFGLGSEFQNSANTFWSWGLTHVIESLYFRKTGHHLEEAVIAGLSGERRAQMEKDEIMPAKSAP